MDLEKSIVLIGYRGCGKTSVAQELSSMTNLPVISTDDRIIKIYGDIPTIVRKEGWEVFRGYEKEIISRLEREPCIVGCGGGIVEDEGNIQKLRKTGIVFWLRASPETIRERIRDSDRPALTEASIVAEVDEVLKRREPLYRKAAHFAIDTEGKSVPEVAAEIIGIMKSGDGNEERKCMVCISVIPENVEQALKDFKEAEKHADIIEIRLDFLEQPDISRLGKLLKGKKKIIVTCRPEQEGGRYSGSEEEREQVLRASLQAGADYVDVEHGTEAARHLLKDQQERVILSWHDYEKTPELEELERRYSEMKSFGAGIIKMVTAANSINDCFRIFRLLNGKEDLVAFCMGMKGQMSRILAGRYGSRMTYACLEGKEAAPGQLSSYDLGVYNIRSINPGTAVLGVIGEHAENSMSKHMHNTCFRKMRMDCVYVPFKAGSDDLRDFMKNYRDNSFGGSVTVPHKEAVIGHLDSLDETASQIGAVNTILNKRGKLSGYNTDYPGAVQALKEKTHLKEKRVLVIGAGGAARAILYGLAREGARVTICNRTKEKAERLANEFKAKVGGMEDLASLVRESEIVINATSIGMNPKPDASILEPGQIAPGVLVMDIVYNPRDTLLLKLAREKGCETISGDRMLVHQAMGQFKLWTGREPEFHVMEDALGEAIKRKEQKKEGAGNTRKDKEEL